MDSVKPFQWERHSVGLNKGEWIPGLRPDVHAHDVIEPGSVIPDSRATSSTKKV